MDRRFFNIRMCPNVTEHNCGIFIDSNASRNDQLRAFDPCTHLILYCKLSVWFIYVYSCNVCMDEN